MKAAQKPIRGGGKKGKAYAPPSTGVNVRLPDSLWMGLAKRAKQDAISRNRVIRDAVAAWLNNNNEDMK
jgi:hypothetical protein